MKIRDIHAVLSKDETTITMPNGGLEIVADDGRTLFSILLKRGVLEVTAGSFCKHNGVALEGTLLIAPKVSNVVEITRPPYELKS